MLDGASGNAVPWKFTDRTVVKAVCQELVMKKLVFGLLAAAAIGAAVPASAETIVHERPNGTVVVNHLGPVHHRLHRVVWFDHRGHRHMAWR
jgi:hypothetical protein